MFIAPCTPDDLPVARAAYATGRDTQREQQSVVWPLFTDAAIMREIETGALFKVLDGVTTAGVFSMISEDPLIWGADERGAHFYLHRIARASTSGHRGLLDVILAWARQRCRAEGRAGLRMDTWAESSALIAYYATKGFQFVGTRQLPADPRLAPHYHGIVLALLESPLAESTNPEPKR
jgi:hypothetical protein